MFAPPSLHLDFDFLIVEFTGTQLACRNDFLRYRTGIRTHEGSEHPLFGGELRARLDVFALALARLCNGDLDQVAHDLLDVAPDVANFGELGRLDLEEWRVGEFGQTAGNLGLADTRRPDHQDILRQHFLAQLVVELQPAPAVTQRDCHGALGIGLTDNETIELGNDFAWREVGHAYGWVRTRGGIDSCGLLALEE